MQNTWAPLGKLWHTLVAVHICPMSGNHTWAQYGQYIWRIHMGFMWPHVGTLRGKTHGYHVKNCCILQCAPLVAAHIWPMRGTCVGPSWGQWNFVIWDDSYGSAEGPPRGVENRNLLSHPDDLITLSLLIWMRYQVRLSHPDDIWWYDTYVIRMTYCSVQKSSG